jgi:peptidyl-tRNA hydrolase, PTH1 family
MVADLLAERWDLARQKTRFGGRIAEGRLPASVPQPAAAPGLASRPRAAVLWPMTYMNEAGRSAGPARGALHVPLDRVLVVHDEIDIPFGEVRARVGGGLAGHNGLKSLRRELGGPDFVRVRVGVGRPPSSDPDVVSAYVLGRFREDPGQVRDLVERAAAETERIVLGGEPGSGPAEPGPAASAGNAPGEPA